MLSIQTNEIPRTLIVNPADPNYANLIAFEGERDALLRTHPHSFAAYHAGRRVAISADAAAAYAIARQAVGEGIILIEQIRPRSADRRYHLRAPFRRKP